MGSGSARKLPLITGSARRGMLSKGSGSVSEKQQQQLVDSASQCFPRILRDGIIFPRRRLREFRLSQQPAAAPHQSRRFVGCWQSRIGQRQPLVAREATANHHSTTAIATSPYCICLLVADEKQGTSHRRASCGVAANLLVVFVVVLERTCWCFLFYLRAFTTDATGLRSRKEMV